MSLRDLINKRRAYRSLEEVRITEDLIYDLAECARLSASCFNNQPWRYVFVYDPEMLRKMREALSPRNAWARNASMMIAVLSRRDYDCVIGDREYYRFDTGMATAFMILRATELGLVAHPIAGYSPKKTRETLDIPKSIDVITLIVVGKHSKTVSPLLSEKQIKAEKKRPERAPLNSFVFMNRYRPGE